jgi:hypothetical protein
MDQTAELSLPERPVGSSDAFVFSAPRAIWSLKIPRRCRRIRGAGLILIVGISGPWEHRQSSKTRRMVISENGEFNGRRSAAGVGIAHRRRLQPAGPPAFSAGQRGRSTSRCHVPVVVANLAAAGLTQHTSSSRKPLGVGAKAQRRNQTSPSPISSASGSGSNTY